MRKIDIILQLLYELEEEYDTELPIEEMEPCFLIESMIDDAECLSMILKH